MAALLFLGLLDAIAGFILTVSPWVPLTGSSILFAIGIIILIKGIISWLMAASGGMFFFPTDLLDIAAGISCLLEVSGFHHNILAWIGFFLLLKGAYSMFIDLIK